MAVTELGAASGTQVAVVSFGITLLTLGEAAVCREHESRSRWSNQEQPEGRKGAGNSSGSRTGEMMAGDERLIYFVRNSLRRVCVIS